MIAGLLGVGVGVRHHEQQTTAAAGLASLPVSPAPALEIGRPDRLPSGRFLSRWTIVRTASPAHAEPSTGSAIVAELTTSTPEGTPNALGVLRAQTGADGRVWVQVRLPVLPNDSVGWVRRRSLGAYQTVNTHLVVD